MFQKRGGKHARVVPARFVSAI